MIKSNLVAIADCQAQISSQFRLFKETIINGNEARMIFEHNIKLEEHMCKDNKKRYYTIQEIAELLGITEEKAHALTLRDNFPKTEIVLQTVVPAKPFVEWLTAQADSKEADNE